jgi:hypothetical protein
MKHIKKFNEGIEEDIHSTNLDINNIRQTIKAALENMYMFGGMPKPDPNYDSYMNRMIEMVMKSIENK